MNGEETFSFFQTAETGSRTPNSGVKGSGADHYPRAPAHIINKRAGGSPDMSDIYVWRMLTAVNFGKEGLTFRPIVVNRDERVQQ